MMKMQEKSWFYWFLLLWSPEQLLSRQVTVFFRSVTWASSGFTHCKVTICSCKWLHWSNFTFACLPPGPYLGCYLSKCRVWIACYVTLIFVVLFFQYGQNPWWWLNFFPGAEVSHLLKWLKSKDWCDACVCEISAANLSSVILTPCISLQSLILSLSKDQILQSHSRATVHLKDKQRQFVQMREIKLT